MNFVPWETPIKAGSSRSTELKEFKFDRHALILKLIEEDTEKNWNLSFESFQALRITTEECSVKIISRLPDNGGFFKSSESPWLKNLGKNEIHFLSDAYHFVICCYDEIIEVVAGANSPKFIKMNNSGIELLLSSDCDYEEILTRQLNILRIN